VDGFSDADRTRSIDTDQAVATMSTQIAALERNQRVSLRRIRRLPDLTATAIVQAVGKRALLLIGAGIAIGSALGGVGTELVRAIVSKWITTLVGH
jgi:hypothetical protein